jgi:hypothetical protein
MRSINYLVFMIQTKELTDSGEIMDKLKIFCFLDQISEFFLSVCIIFFMFEMVTVRAILMSNTRMEIQKSHKWISRFKIFVIVVYLILTLVS